MWRLELGYSTLNALCGAFGVWLCDFWLFRLRVPVGRGQDGWGSMLRIIVTKLYAGFAGLGVGGPGSRRTRRRRGMRRSDGSVADRIRGRP